MAEAVNASSSAPVAGATRVWCPNADRQTEARHLFVQRESADDQVPVRFQSFIASFVGQSHCSGWLLFFPTQWLQPASAAGASADASAVSADTSPKVSRGFRTRHVAQSSPQKKSTSSGVCILAEYNITIYISLTFYEHLNDDDEV